MTSEYTAFKKYKSMQELQGKQELNRAIPVCKFIRVLKNDSKRLHGDKMLDFIFFMGYLAGRMDKENQI